MSANQRTVEMIVRIRAGSQDAFEQFFREWYARLADYAASLLQNRDAAEDAVQEVMVALWDRKDAFPDAEIVAAYLHRAVRNRALNQVRSQQSADRTLHRPDQQTSVPPTAEAELRDQELDAKLRRALADLPPRTREVFLLSRDQGLTYPEVATTLDISVKTVETLMGRALQALRKTLRPDLLAG